MAASLGNRKTAHCLFISANRVTTPYPVFPIGVAHVMGSLEENGHCADHYDLLAEGGLEGLEELLRTNRYDLIGVSIRNIDSVDSASPRPMIDDIATVMEVIRRCSNTPVVLGGPGFSIMPEQLLSHLGAEYGVVGEGENAMEELLAKLLSGKPFDQRLFSAPLTGFPEYRPCYSSASTGYYIDHGGMLNVQTKRGCSYGCSYCSYPAIEGRKIRYRNPEEVAAEVQRLAVDYRARYIFFTDSVFNDPERKYLEIAEALIRNGNTTPWCAFFRPENIGTTELKLLKRSGLGAMELGTDAASDETLAGMNKGFSFAQAKDVSDAIVRENIPCAHFIVFGGLRETEETVRQGLDNIALLENCVVFAYIGLRILPGTRLYKQAIREGVVTPETDIIPPLFYYSPHVSREYMEKQLRNSFQGRNDRIFPMVEMEDYVRLLHSLGHSGPLWDLMLKPRLKQ